MRASVTRALLGSILLSVSACGSTATATKEEASCPAAGVLDSAGRQTKFPDGGMAGAAVYEARIAGVSAVGCRVERDGTGLVDLRLVVQLTRGAASTGTDYPVTYFVAVVDPRGQVLSRQAFRVDFRVPVDRNGASANEELTVRIPRPDKAPLGEYRIYAALQLTAEELEYNRQTGAR